MPCWIAFSLYQGTEISAHWLARLTIIYHRSLVASRWGHFCIFVFLVCMGPLQHMAVTIHLYFPSVHGPFPQATAFLLNILLLPEGFSRAPSIVQNLALGGARTWQIVFQALWISGIVCRRPSLDSNTNLMVTQLKMSESGLWRS